MRERQTRLIVVSAPSGVGKSTVCNHLRKRSSDVAVSISYTTRAPRGKEKDGQHYHFVDDAEFESMIEQGAFLEWADVHAKRYGTGKQDCDALLAQGKDVLFDIDVQGGMQIKEQRPDALLVFLLPPAVDEWVRRLRQRGTDADEVIALRLRNAIEEMEMGRSYDHFVINDEVDKAVRELDALRLAEHPEALKTSGSAGILAELLESARKQLS